MLPFGVVTSTEIWSPLAQPVRVIPTPVPGAVVFKIVAGKVLFAVQARLLPSVLSTAVEAIVDQVGMGVVH